MRVRLRNPDREVEVAAAMSVSALLSELDIVPHTVLVLCDGRLVTAAHELDSDAEVEIRPVISGGSVDIPGCVVCRAPAVIADRRGWRAGVQGARDQDRGDRRRAARVDRELAPVPDLVVAVIGPVVVIVAVIVAVHVNGNGYRDRDRPP